MTAVGHVDEDSEGRGLRAEILASGSFEIYRKGERGSAVFGLAAAAILGLAGLVLVFLGITL